MGTQYSVSTTTKLCGYPMFNNSSLHLLTSVPTHWLFLWNMTICSGNGGTVSERQPDAVSHDCLLRLCWDGFRKTNSQSHMTVCSGYAGTVSERQTPSLTWLSAQAMLGLRKTNSQSHMTVCSGYAGTVSERQTPSRTWLSTQAMLGRFQKDKLLISHDSLLRLCCDCLWKTNSQSHMTVCSGYAEMVSERQTPSLTWLSTQAMLGQFQKDKLPVSPHDCLLRLCCDCLRKTNSQCHMTVCSGYAGTVSERCLDSKSLILETHIYIIKTWNLIVTQQDWVCQLSGSIHNGLSVMINTSQRSKSWFFMMTFVQAQSVESQRSGMLGPSI